MPAPPLDVVESNCRFEIRAAVDDVVSGAATPHAVGNLCRWFRALAACRLFWTGLPDEFVSYLRHGPAAALHYASVHPGRLSASRLLPVLCDAIATRDWPLATEVAGLLPTERDARTEYEDDFRYARALGAAVRAWSARDGSGADDAPGIADGVDAMGEARGPIVQALVDRDAGAFDEALSELLDGYETSFEERYEADEIGAEMAATIERVSVEGLALVGLARLRGLETRPNYVQVPSLAIPREDRSSADRSGWQTVAAR